MHRMVTLTAIIAFGLLTFIDHYRRDDTTPAEAAGRNSTYVASDAETMRSWVKAASSASTTVSYLAQAYNNLPSSEYGYASTFTNYSRVVRELRDYSSKLSTLS